MSAEPKRRGRPPKVAPVEPAEAPREARRNAAEQGDDVSPPAVVFEAPKPAIHGSMIDYIAAIEGERLADGVVLVRVSHPGAVTGVHQGRYSGIHTSQGPEMAHWSDGTQSTPDA